ncbi:unnamed protein product [Fraxinus pennsylvanica]|uniref:Integrase catalytic domain-containing protein n=1 Tax=Fraxinus pennsylvanica TaxID=56036 RepID=A0AAD1Z642_9LAMI|nr:unnamed protein product [Fraxinus pennsylvanica]
MNLATVNSEVNMVDSNPKEWWIDIEATGMCVLIKNYLRLSKQLRMERSCLWEIQQLLKSWVKENDSTKYCYVYLLKSKDEAIEKFIFYKNEIENQLNKKIKVLRSDRGGEYEAPFAEFCAQHGIIHETTAPYSPQQNDVAERKKNIP